MALRLNDLVIRGELSNTKNYSTRGWLQLRGRSEPLLLQLTGNCSPDLQGKQIRFEVRNAPEPNEPEPPDDELQEPLYSRLAWQQVGPTGTMTATHQVKVADCSPEELHRRCSLGEPPPTQWKPCLYLEWFSQNGRVVLELVDPAIEYVQDESDEGRNEPGGGHEPAGQSESERAEDRQAPSEGDLATPENQAEDPALDSGGDDEPSLSADEADADGAFEDEDDEESDPYGLFPEDLQLQFDQDASALDRAIANDEDQPDSIREMELMDELIERGEGDIIGSIFEEPLRLPRPEQLSDNEVEQTLKTLLAELALFGIALDVCEHFSPRDAYRLLLDKICSQERTYPELRRTQWVQHFMTSEFCEECDAEMQREFEEYERRRGDESNEDLPQDDDLPF